METEERIKHLEKNIKYLCWSVGILLLGGCVLFLMLLGVRKFLPLSTPPEQTSPEVRAEQFTVVGPNGETRAIFGSNAGTGYLQTFDSNGKKLVEIGKIEVGIVLTAVGSIRTFDERGTELVNIGARNVGWGRISLINKHTKTQTEIDGGGVLINNKYGNNVVGIGTDLDGRGLLEIVTQNEGQDVVAARITSLEDGSGSLLTYNNSGKSVVIIGTTDDGNGDGTISTYDGSGKRLVAIE